MPGAMAAMAGAQIAGGVIGYYQGKKDREKASALMDEALATIKAIGAPPDLSKEIILQQFQQAGMMTPELEHVIDFHTSKVSQDYRKVQEDALRGMSQVARTGFGAQDLNALNQIQEAEAVRRQGQEQAIMQGMQQRGLGGAGSELAARLSNVQAGNKNASANSMQVAADSALRRMQAMGQQSDISNQLEGKQNAIDQYNTENARSVQMRNIGSKNAAQQYNIGNQQNVSNANVQQANQELYRQAQAKQDYWTNKLNQASAVSNALTGQSNYAAGQAQNKAAMWTGMGNAVGSGVGAYGDQQYDAEQRDLDRKAGMKTS